MSRSQSKLGSSLRWKSFWRRAAFVLILNFPVKAEEPKTAMPLARSVTTEQQTASLQAHLGSLLRDAGVWGGIEDYRIKCEPVKERRTKAFRGSLASALQRTKQEFGTLSWKEEDGGVLVRSGATGDSPLDLRLQTFSFDVYDSPIRITDELLNSPFVAARIQNQGFSVRGPELGFAQARSDSHKQVTLKNVTVRDVLNYIARSLQPRVWLFEEVHCAQTKSIRVQWLVK